MQLRLRFLPLAASAVAGRSFLTAHPRPMREGRRRIRYNAGNASSSEKEGEEVEAGAARGPTEDTLRRLAELDAQLEGLSEPKMRPPAPPLPAEPPYMDREVMTGRAGSTDELPEITPSYVAFSTLALFILTIFTNVMFSIYIKPSVDGVDRPERIERVALVDPGIQQAKQTSNPSSPKVD